jgi:general secretion pathway protein D
MIKILSSPRVTVRDGKNASIVVGTEVPVIMSEATTPDVQVEGTSGIIRSVEYRTTGVSLNVTPSVHAKGIVTLEITQEVSEAQQNPTSDISSPIILKRTVTTEVVAADGQTILLGGLIAENRSQTVTKVPILGSIPILGNLFKTTTEGTNRTELVIMITPHIIRNTQQIDEMRDAFFESLKYLDMEK